MSSRMRQFLLEALDDHLQLWWLMPDVNEVADPEHRQRETLQLVYEMLASGWFDAGFPTPSGREFEPWQLSTEESLARIAREWQALGREPNIGEIVWFSLTPSGEAEAHKYAARA
jgi:hypothetical protein